MVEISHHAIDRYYERILDHKIETHHKLRKIVSDLIAKTVNKRIKNVTNDKVMISNNHMAVVTNGVVVTIYKANTIEQKKKKDKYINNFNGPSVAKHIANRNKKSRKATAKRRNR